jgi:hypothetical protein
VDNNYLDLGMNKSGFIHTLPSGRLSATKVTPFELVYGQEAVLPVEVNLGAYRLAKQNNLDVESY